MKRAILVAASTAMLIAAFIRFPVTSVDAALCDASVPISCTQTMSLANIDLVSMQKIGTTLYGCTLTGLRYRLVTTNGSIVRDGSCIPKPPKKYFHESNKILLANLIRGLLQNADCKNVTFSPALSWASNPISTGTNSAAFVSLGGVGSLYSCTVPTVSSPSSSSSSSAVFSSQHSSSSSSATYEYFCNGQAQAGPCSSGSSSSRTGSSAVSSSSSSSVAPAVCNNGIQETGEECDDGNPSNTDSCTTACHRPACGDRYMQSEEQCDDGNTESLDGCSASCVIENGFSCSGTPSVCTRCGNGVLDAGETCDDQGRNPGDGCSASCFIEIGFSCSEQPSRCISNRDRVKALSDTDQNQVVIEKEARDLLLNAVDALTKPFDQVRQFDINDDGRITIDDLRLIIIALNSLLP